MTSILVTEFAKFGETFRENSTVLVIMWTVTVDEILDVRS